MMFYNEYKKLLKCSQKLTVCIENEEKEDIVIIFADPSVKVIQIQIVISTE